MMNLWFQSNNLIILLICWKKTCSGALGILRTQQLVAQGRTAGGGITSDLSNGNHAPPPLPTPIDPFGEIGCFFTENALKKKSGHGGGGRGNSRAKRDECAVEDNIEI